MRRWPQEERLAQANSEVWTSNRDRGRATWTEALLPFLRPCPKATKGETLRKHTYTILMIVVFVLIQVFFVFPAVGECMENSPNQSWYAKVLDCT